MEIDGLACGEPKRKILPSRDLGAGHMPCEVQDIQERPRGEPVTVVVDLGAIQVDNSSDLLKVIFGELLDLFAGQSGSGLVTAGGVAHERGVVANDDHGRMTEILKLAELAQGN